MFSYKVQKTCFWAIFAQWGLNLAVTHNYVWVPYIMLSSRRNLWANSEKTYGQTLFYRTLLAKAGGHKKKQNKKKEQKTTTTTLDSPDFVTTDTSSASMGLGICI